MNSPTTIVESPVDPSRVPQRLLASGVSLPAIGLGTFGSDHVTPDEIAAAVRYAASIGYRHFDCASVYGNELQIGTALHDIMRSGINRRELWITSKLWNDKHATEDVIPACKQSLSDLGLDYLDLYLVHWPFPNFHPPFCDVSSRSPDSKPYIHESFLATWRKMEQLVDSGLVRYIGTSNMTIPKLKLLLRDARIRPVINEMELHPHFQQPELFDFVTASGIAPVGYSPIGSPGRPERDRTSDDTVDMEDPVIVSIAQRLQIHPAVVCLKWAIQRGQIPIPFSVKPRNILANLQGAVSEPLTGSDMKAIAAIDKNCRLIKGTSFFVERQSKLGRSLGS